jgi:hypothetical protein
MFRGPQGIPTISSGDSGKVLAVKSDESGAEWSNGYVPTSLTTTTPTASSIPIADSGGKIDDGWIPATVARKESPTFTGTPVAPTAPSGTSTGQIATTEFVKTVVDVGIASNDAMALRGTLGTGGTAASLPTEGYLVGWTYKVVSSGTYAGQACSIGDLMICVSSFNTAYKDADWSRVPISDEYSDYYLLEGDPA